MIIIMVMMMTMMALPSRRDRMNEQTNERTNGGRLGVPITHIVIRFLFRIHGFKYNE